MKRRVSGIPFPARRYRISFAAAADSLKHSLDDGGDSGSGADLRKRAAATRLRVSVAVNRLW